MEEENIRGKYGEVGKPRRKIEERGHRGIGNKG
jgi:hypothetical protein